MPSLRSARAANSLVAGFTSGPALELLLADPGRSSEFGVLLSMRSMVRRFANSTLAMTGITQSPRAINLIFQLATTETSNACQEVVRSALAMNITSNSTPSLDALAANLVSWGLFSKSPHYEANVKTVVARLARVNPDLYPTMTALIADATAMADISVSATSMAAVVASAPTVAIMVADSTAFGLAADNTVAIDTMAKEAVNMPLVANSTIAMGHIATRPVAMTRMATYPGSIQAVADVPAAWATYLASTHFAANLPLALANLIGVSPSAFPTLDSLIASPITLGKIAAKTQAVQALASNSAAMTTLSISPNLGIVLSSTIAMAVIGPNVTAMTSFLNASGAWAGLFASSVAKGFIVASTALVNVIAGNAALITYLGTKAVNNVTATGLPDGNATSLQPFNASPALPAKLLTLSAKETGIAATYSNYNFGGSVIAGANAGATLSLSGTGPGGQPAHIAGYTNMSWNFQGIGVTAATLPIITYVDMT